MNRRLTRHQSNVLHYIQGYLASNDNRFAPTNGEIAEAFGISEHSASRLISRLRAKGYLQRTGKWRSLRIVPLPEMWIEYGE